LQRDARICGKAARKADKLFDELGRIVQWRAPINGSQSRPLWTQGMGRPARQATAATTRSAGVEGLAAHSSGYQACR
jgi:hypothetical protein